VLVFSIWVGVVLGAPIGKNDGSVKGKMCVFCVWCVCAVFVSVLGVCVEADVQTGKRYFTCDPKYGLMVPIERVSPWDARAVSPQRVVSPHNNAALAHVNRLKKAQQQRKAK
jgi:dynactin complex subunit